MNNTINPPMKTRNKMKENQEVLIKLNSNSLKIRACLLIMITISIGWEVISIMADRANEINDKIFISEIRE
jgi:hypothetical protein